MADVPASAADAIAEVLMVYPSLKRHAGGGSQFLSLESQLWTIPIGKVAKSSDLAYSDYGWLFALHPEKTNPYDPQVHFPPTVLRETGKLS